MLHYCAAGIGTRAAALYVAWAQQYENRSMNEQADAVYHKAMENQAQPADTVLHEYRCQDLVSVFTYLFIRCFLYIVNF
uniref:Uncharacterized protein n=1 Tax=Monopterus albus TaxID=43700 RepID=A0A3Q3JMP2_MONAL